MSISSKEYEHIRHYGEPAEARIRGILRGGYAYNGVFYAPAATNIGVLSDTLENVTELKIRKRDDT